ncbi:hypothetical protein D9M69_692020 [compost metagenome]
MAARVGAAGAEGAHDAGEAFGPVAGTKSAAIVGDALDEDFFGVGGNHREVRRPEQVLRCSKRLYPGPFLHPEWGALL